MSRKPKFSYKQKLLAVQSYLAGKGSLRSLADEIGSCEKNLRRWLALYKRHGKEGLKMYHGTYPGSFKVSVVRYMLENHLTLLEATAHFGIPGDGTIYKWLRIYEEQGAAGLYQETRGRKKTMPSKKPRKSKKLSTSTDEGKLAALEAELEYLRAENAFLKKLRALIQEEEAARMQSKRQKPSVN
jgi:transposase